MVVRERTVSPVRPLPLDILAAEAATALVWAYLVALSAQLRVHLPFSPVPITAQTFVVLLGGALLGSRRGLLAASLYLLGGVAGLPVFTVSTPAGPTGGYLIGFVAGAYVVGRLFERGGSRLGGRAHPVWALLVFILGHGVIYAFGLPWLALFVGWRAVLPLGLSPFLVGDLVKCVCAAAVVVARQRGDGVPPRLDIR
jgi:biotin transport system substrate-specific component